VISKTAAEVYDEALNSTKTHLLEVVCQDPNMPVHEERSAWIKQVEGRFDEADEI
jgi:uncharacterized protein (UPF0147 family)